MSTGRDGANDGAQGADGEALTAAQRARIERNRLRARTLQDARLVTRLPKGEAATSCASAVHVLDSGGGFLLETGEEATPRRAEHPAPLVNPDEQPRCLECDRLFPQSYLFDTFDYSVCDECRSVERAAGGRTRSTSRLRLTDRCSQGRQGGALAGDAHRGQKRVPAQGLRLRLAAAAAALCAPAQPTPRALQRDAVVPARAGGGARAGSVGLGRAAGGGARDAPRAAAARSAHARAAAAARATHERALEPIRSHARRARTQLWSGAIRCRRRRIRTRVHRLRPQRGLREDVTAPSLSMTVSRCDRDRLDWNK